MPLDATTKDDVYVGRIRSDISRDDGKGLELFVCGDQIKKVGGFQGSGAEGVAFRPPVAPRFVRAAAAEGCRGERAEGFRGFGASRVAGLRVWCGASRVAGLRVWCGVGGRA
jgi:hypothetical protein